MARFLLVTWDGGGNQPPMFGLARQLLDRGHDVRVLGEPSQQRRVEATAAEFRAYSCGLPVDITKSAESQMPAYFSYWAGGLLAEELQAQLRQQQPDVIVVDCMLLGVLCVAEKSGLPTASLVHFLYAPAAHGIFGAAYQAFRPMVNETRAQLGLEPLPDEGNLLDQVYQRCSLVLAATARSFDEPIEHLPANVRYTGPITADGSVQWTWDLPWPTDDTKPLISVSLSTTNQDQLPLLQRIIDALATVPAHVLVTYGDGVDGGALRSPDNTVAREFVPHSAVFPHLAVMVTHAGHSTAINTLAAGVPLVCLAMGRDQPIVAARVAACGAGVSVPHTASEEQIRTAVTDVMSMPSFRENAQRMASLIAQEMAAIDLMGELERLLPG